MLPGRRNEHEENVHQSSPRASFSSPFASSALHPSAPLPLRNGRSPGTVGFYSSQNSSAVPARALHGLPSSSQYLPPAARNPSRTSNFERLQANAFENGVGFGGVSFSQDSSVVASGYSAAYQPAWPTASWEPPPRRALDSHTIQYGRTAHQSPAAIYNYTSPYQAIYPAPTNHHWHGTRQDARPGEDASYQPRSPPPYDEVEAARLPSRPSSSMSIALPNRANEDDVGSQTATDVSDWPNVCLRCNEINSPLRSTQYETLHHWLVHAWTCHPNDAQWTTQPCFWPGCHNNKLYPTPKKCLDHIASVHMKNIYCNVFGCDYNAGNIEGKAFGTSSDLNRHQQQVHSPPQHCPLEHCIRNRRVLNRTDHRKNHERNYHGEFCCRVPGCLRGHIDGVNYGFATPALRDDHMRKNRHPTIGTA